METNRATAQSVFFLYAEENLHFGEESGPSDVDRPVQREATTGFVRGGPNGLRRALRDPFQKDDRALKDEERIFFGSNLRPDDTGQEFGSGILSVRGVRILLFPIQTSGPVFAWVTCPLAVARLRRVLANPAEVPTFSQIPPDNVAVGSQSELMRDRNRWVEIGGAAFQALEDPPLATAVDRLAAWLRRRAIPQLDHYAYWRDLLVARDTPEDGSHGASRLAIVGDEQFRWFCETACDYSTHIRIDPESGTVVSGALWTQEDVPEDAVLFSLIEMGRPPRGSPDPFQQDGRSDATKALAQFKARVPDNTVLQVGGDQGEGLGYVRTRWVSAR